MAEKKPVSKKAPAKVSADKKPAVKDLATLTKKLAEKQNDLIESKRSHAAGELVNPRVLTVTRREIARLKTAIRTHELTAAKENK